MANRDHAPVLLREVLEALSVKPEGTYLDATYGRGGHAEALLDQLDERGRLILVDRDPQAIEEAIEKFRGDDRVSVMHRTFADLDEIFAACQRRNKLDGVLMDLGVSSPQLDDPRRGFSFLHDGPLDMRMDTSRGPSAAEWLAAASEAELLQVLREYGEVKHARQIAKAILSERAAVPITTTRQLAEVIERAAVRERNKHPATQTFQAIRMVVNRELEQLRAALPQAVRLLRAGGRLVVISFHSLEDRIVKRFMRRESRGDFYPPDAPIPTKMLRPRLRVIGKVIRPSAAETSNNPRARSAVMRVAERTGVAYA